MTEYVLNSDCSENKRSKLFWRIGAVSFAAIAIVIACMTPKFVDAYQVEPEIQDFSDVTASAITASIKIEAVEKPKPEPVKQPEPVVEATPASQTKDATTAIEAPVNTQSAQAVSDEENSPIIEVPGGEVVTHTASAPAVIDGNYDIPNVDSRPKTYMDYRTITNTASLQYKLQQSATTDEYGFRRYNDYYMIALGTYYTGYECGKYFRITLDTGETFDAITGDIKDDRDTDALHQHMKESGNIVEFIVDVNHLSSKAKRMGDMSYSEGVKFSGKVVKIERIQPN